MNDLITKQDDTRLTQDEIDVKNLRFYATLFAAHQWETPQLHWSVFAQTLEEIANRMAELSALKQSAEEMQRIMDTEI